MKKNFIYALMSAIALTGAVGFTACSSSDEVAQENNPTYDGTSVRTDFAFSIAGGPMSGTRMAGDVVQQSGSGFNGMVDMYLLPFNEVPAGNKTTDYANGTTYNYPLGTLTGITTTASSKVYSLQIPVGTTNFLFYATSNPSVTATDALPVAAQKGSLTSSLNQGVQNTDAINFQLDKILTTTTLGNDATALANYLNYIVAQAKSGDIDWWETPEKALTDGSYSILATLYKKFTTINDNTARAGSAEAVLRSVFDLYVTADRTVKLTNASTTDVYKIADAICTAITTGPTSGIKVGITIPSGKEDSPSDWTCAWNGLTNTTFPHNLYLPMGAAQLTYNETDHVFSYKDPVWYDLHVTDNTTTPVTIGGTGVNLSKICYPAELIYFDNSPLRATNAYKKVSDYPVTVAAWDGAFANPTSGDWTGQRVEPTTRAVAMQNNVNYGVAMLKATVKAEDGDAVTDGIQMYDNQQSLAGGTADKTIAADFKVTGILIGGQPKYVGWDMTNPSLPDENDNPKGKLVFDNVIYDQHIPFTTAIGTSESAPIYTLVLDNYTTANSETQSKVRFALELKNDSGEDFYGIDGLIPAGHTFYLCGEMDPTAATGVIAKTNSGREGTDYRITKEDKQRVFMQDYQTTASITIKKNAIKKAYSTIPDLRATEVLFGLSVDLKWETGMSFNVNIE